MFAILGFGYSRFLYDNSAIAFSTPDRPPHVLTDWFVPRGGSSVFVALLVMGIPMLPGLWGPMLVWSGGCTAAQKWAVCRHVVWSTVRAVAVMYAAPVPLPSPPPIRFPCRADRCLCAVCSAVGFVVYIEFGASASMRAYVSDGPVGPYAPLIGHLVANTVFMAVALWPLLVLRTSEAEAEAPAAAVDVSAEKAKAA
jgi:hypothetical protein